jgi:hypothetical protein
MQRIVHACCVLALTVVFASTSLAQIGTSTITGRVTDPSGSVVPNVTITVTQEDTNFTFPSTSNNEGLYRVQSLQPGKYKITFELQGFKKLVRDNVDLRVGDTLAVDAQLQVGEIGESIEVTAQTQLLETETSASGAVVEGAFLYKMPLYQRYINSTLNIIPGMTSGGYAYGGDLGAYHLAGQRNGAIGVFEDGVVGNDQMGGTGTIKPIQNSTEEVKVLTTALPAEYGHSAGGVINVVKKTGTNEWHGLASYYGRFRRMQHRLYFDRLRTSQPTATNPEGVPTYFMMPDANVSGPIKKDKTFFFFGYQRLHEKKIAQDRAGVPTPAMKAGNFTMGGNGNPIYDPATTRQLADGTWVRDPFPGNIIPTNRFDPVAQKLLSINPWHSPNIVGGNSSTGPSRSDPNLEYNEFAKVFFDDFNVRIDHQFSSNLKAYGSWTHNRQNGLGRPRNVSILDFDAREGNDQPFHQHNASTGMTWVVNPTTVNDARIGFFRRRNDRIVPSYKKNYGQILGIPNITDDLLPAFVSGGGDNFSADTAYGLDVSGPSRTIGETISFRDDFSKTRGVHAFKMGYEVLKHRLNLTDTGRPSGLFSFANMTSGLQPNANAVPNTGNTFAGLLLGYVSQASFNTELASWLPRSTIHSFYFQDDWKFSPTLTLNLGVRYTNESPFNTKYGNMSNFDPNATDPVTGRRGGIIHPDSALSARDNNNFQPRVGVAWHPAQKWVFRGGFALNTVDVKFPSSRGQFEEYVSSANQQRAPGDPTPLFRLSQGPAPVVYPIRPDGTSPFIGTNYGGRSSEWWDPSLRNPYVLNWNMSVQYELTQNYLLEFSYQASSGVGLAERWQINTFPIDFGKGDLAFQNTVLAAAQNYRPYTHFGDIRMRSNFGHSTFHSGTVKLEKRYSYGLTFTNFYTWSKALDSQDNDNDGTGVAPIQNRAWEKGRAGFDRNHRYIAAVTYELPVGQGRKWMNTGGWKDYVLGGYELAWLQTIESGNPLSFGFDGSPNNYYPTFAGNRRPNLVSQPVLRDNWIDLGPDRFTAVNINPILDINHFAYPAAFTPGNAGRNITTGTRLLWSQVSASKGFKITEKLSAKFRWDFQNCLKTYNFNTPTTTVDFRNPRTFAKLSTDPRTASLGGQPLMNITFALMF